VLYVRNNYRLHVQRWGRSSVGTPQSGHS